MDNIEEFREKLAALCHDQWVHWMSYLFSKCANELDDYVFSRTPTGNKIILRSLVEHWQKQMQTPYAELSEKEKESDREQADKFLEVINEFLKTECL